MDKLPLSPASCHTVKFNRFTPSSSNTSESINNCAFRPALNNIGNTPQDPSLNKSTIPLVPGEAVDVIAAKNSNNLSLPIVFKRFTPAGGKIAESSKASASDRHAMPKSILKKTSGVLQDTGLNKEDAPSEEKRVSFNKKIIQINFRAAPWEK